MVRRARVALVLLEAISQVVQTAREPMTGPVRLGVIPTIGPFILPGLLPLIEEKFPQIRLIITEDMTERLLEKITTGRLDVLLLAMPCICDGLETVPLWRDPFMLVLPRRHELAALSVVPLERLTEERMILLEDGHCLRDQTVDVCRQGRAWVEHEADAAHTVSSLHTLVRMIGTGLGVGIIPKLAIDSGILEGADVVARPLTGGPAWRTIGLGWRTKSPTAEDFHLLAHTLRTLAPDENRVPGAVPA